MSLQQAVDEIRTRLNAISGLQEVADLRDDTLDASSKGNLDGAYNLRIQSSGNPWPELSQGPTQWWALFELEVGHVVANDRVATSVAEATHAQQIRETLQYDALTYGQVWDQTEPIIQTSPTNPKLRVWRWRWKLRYQE
jgi:hypothetical protein